MALIGSIEHFNPKVSNITSYLERFEELFSCNSITIEEEKVSLFLTLIGGEAYETIADLVTPDLPATKTFKQLKELLSTHYGPNVLVITERYKFYNADQEKNENINAFVARLKKLGATCEFGAFLQEALRDKFVCGVKSKKIRGKLLSIQNLTFEKAFQVASGMELSDSEFKLINLAYLPIYDFFKLPFREQTIYLCAWVFAVTFVLYLFMRIPTVLSTHCKLLNEFNNL